MLKKKKIKFSIFFKLILLIIIFIILVNLLLGYFINFSLDRPPGGLLKKPPPPPHFHEFIIKEIGFPPDTNKARGLSNELNLGIRYETSDLKWTTNDNIPGIDELKKNSDFRNDVHEFPVKTGNRMYFVHNIPDGYIIFSPPVPRDFINFEKAIIAIILIVTILGLLLYFSLRWIFGPIKKLSEGVEEISAGNFESQIEVNRSDELGNLAKSINEMKSNISEMIKAKESLLIDVSHELRSPLTRLKLAAEFVEENKIKNMLRGDIKEMEAMVTELLETYRMEKDQIKLNQEITDIIELIRNIIVKFSNAKINFKTDLDKKEVNIDKSKIEVAIRNILDNAVKYSGGKEVDVRVFENEKNKEETCVSIRDYGNGIEESELKNIFEPFYRIDKSRDKKISGYGLGLSLVKKIVDMHNAVIEIRSTPSEGTEFKITFK